MRGAVWKGHDGLRAVVERRRGKVCGGECVEGKWCEGEVKSVLGEQVLRNEGWE